MNRVNLSRTEIRALICICVAQILCSADNTANAILIKDIISTYNISLSAGQMVTSAYGVVSASVVISCGLLGYYICWKNLFRVGLFLFALGEISTPFTSGVWQFLIISRGLTGLGAAFILPSCIAIVTRDISPNNRAISFSIYATSMAFVIVVFPFIATGISHMWGWEACFVAIGGFAFFVLAFSSVWITYKPPVVPSQKFDYLGTCLTTVTISCALLALTLSLSGSRFSLPIPASLSIKPVPLPLLLAALSVTSGVVCFLSYSKYNNRQKTYSALPAVFFKREAISGLYVLAFQYIIYGGVLFSLISYLSFSSYTQANIAVMIAVFALSMFLTSTTVATRNGLSIKSLNTAGMFILSVSILGLASNLAIHTSVYIISGWLVLIGSGCGILACKANIAINESVGAGYAQQSSGVQISAKNFGYVIGITLSGCLLSLFAKYEMSTELQRIATVHFDSHCVMTHYSFVSNQQLNNILSKCNIRFPGIRILNDISRLNALKYVLYFASSGCLLSIPLGRSVQT